MAEHLRTRLGLETDMPRMYSFFRARYKEMRTVLEQESYKGAAEKAVETLLQYTELDKGEMLSPEQVERHYEHYRKCIGRSQADLQAYFESMLVLDVRHRVDYVEEIDGVNDPLQLIDMAMTSDDPMVQFEARRALHMGATYFEIDHRIGTPEELRQRKEEVGWYLEQGLIGDARSSNVVIHHGVQSENSHIEPNSIRVPLIDGTDPERRIGENQVHVAIRQIPSLNPDRKQPISFVLGGRPKSHWSIFLKSLRKGAKVSAITDPIGFSFYVDSQDGADLREMVQRLEAMFDIVPKDKIVHPLVNLENAGRQETDRNADSSKTLRMHKMIARWNPSVLLQDEKKLREVIGRRVSRAYNQDRMIERITQHAQRTMPTEFILGTLSDMLRNNFEGGDDDHRIYKVKQAGAQLGPDDSRIVFEMLAPKRLYTVDWRSPEIQEAMLQKQRAEVGIHLEALRNARNNGFHNGDTFQTSK